MFRHHHWCLRCDLCHEYHTSSFHWCFYKSTMIMNLRCYCVFGLYFCHVLSLFFGENWRICAVCVFLWFNGIDENCFCCSNTIPIPSYFFLFPQQQNVWGLCTIYRFRCIPGKLGRLWEGTGFREPVPGTDRFCGSKIPGSVSGTGSGKPGFRDIAKAPGSGDSVPKVPKVILYFERALFYFESILLYFASRLLYFESLLLYFEV